MPVCSCSVGPRPCALPPLPRSFPPWGQPFPSGVTPSLGPLSTLQLVCVDSLRPVRNVYFDPQPAHAATVRFCCPFPLRPAVSCCPPPPGPLSPRRAASRCSHRPVCLLASSCVVLRRLASSCVVLRRLASSCSARMNSDPLSFLRARVVEQTGSSPESADQRPFGADPPSREAEVSAPAPPDFPTPGLCEQLS
jgi:hypothetical protein